MSKVYTCNVCDYNTEYEYGPHPSSCSGTLRKVVLEKSEKKCPPAPKKETPTVSRIYTCNVCGYHSEFSYGSHPSSCSGTCYLMDYPKLPLNKSEKLVRPSTPAVHNQFRTPVKKQVSLQVPNAPRKSTAPVSVSVSKPVYIQIVPSVKPRPVLTGPESLFMYDDKYKPVYKPMYE